MACDMSFEAEHVLDVLERWLLQQNVGKSREERKAGASVTDLGNSVNGVYLTRFTASRIRKAFGELYGLGLVCVVDCDMSEPLWKPTTPEQRRTL